MIPKEKAIELFNKMYKVENMLFECMMDKFQAKQTATISVQEILNFMIKDLKWDDKTNGNIHFWQEVLDEIERL